jgi:hypothetical protein
LQGISFWSKKQVRPSGCFMWSWKETKHQVLTTNYSTNRNILIGFEKPSQQWCHIKKLVLDIIFGILI